jgi:uncharacterized protein (TIGR02145 family)
MQDNYTGDTTLFFKIKHDCGQDTIWDIASTLVAIKDVEMEDAVNGKNYPTVRLGCDCWTAKNFEGRLDPNGDPVANMIYKSDLYPDTVANLAAFGRLYTYDAATLGGMSAQGICPAGWRLPSAAEWALLNGYAAADLKQLGTGYWMNEQATNKTGLSIVPGGYYESSTGTFKHLLGDAWYWAYDAGNTQTIVPACHFTFGCPEAIIQQIIRANGASVRCIKAE